MAFLQELQKVEPLKLHTKNLWFILQSQYSEVRIPKRKEKARVSALIPEILFSKIPSIRNGVDAVAEETKAEYEANPDNGVRIFSNTKSMKDSMENSKEMEKIRCKVISLIT